MIDGAGFVSQLTVLGISHVVWLPDSAIGPWEKAIEQAPGLTLVRVCRESEAWVIAAGLMLGGKKPLVVIQNTGLFDSGDALRNIMHDLKLPVFALIGYRSYLISDSPDSAKKYTEPVLDAWGVNYKLIDSADKAHLLTDHYRHCQATGQVGAVLLAEGRM